MAYVKPRLGYYDPNGDDPSKFFEATPEQIAEFRKPYWDADTGQRMQNPALPGLGYERDARSNVPQVTLSNGVTGTPQFDPDTGNFTVGMADPKSSRGGFMYTVDPDTGNILKTEEYDPNSGEGDWKDFLKFGLGAAGIYGAGAGLSGLFAGGSSSALAGMDAGLAGLEGGVIGEGGLASLAPIAGDWGAAAGPTGLGLAEGSGSALVPAGIVTADAGLTGNATVDKLIKSFAPAAIGAYAANKRAGSLADIAGLYKPGLDRLEASYQPGFSMR